MTRDTFGVDNWWVQNSPTLYGTRRVRQLYLPGMEPFSPFDLWATLGLYSLIAPADPTAEVRTTPTAILDVLNFAKVVNEAFGYPTHTSDDYRMIDEALQRLFTVEVHLRNYYNKVKKGSRGRPSKEWVEYSGRILVSYKYHYPEDVTPPEVAPRSKRINVNRATTPDGQPGPPIWKLNDSSKATGISFRFAPDLVQGLQGGNIGATIFPIELFTLRPQLQPYPIATRLLVWTLRQTRSTIDRKLDTLANEINIRGKDRKRNRESIVKYLELLEELGIVADLQVDPLNNRVIYRKATGWHFAKGKSVE